MAIKVIRDGFIMVCEYFIMQRGTFRILSTGKTSTVDSYYQWLIQNGVPVESSIEDIFNYVSSYPNKVEVDISFLCDDCFYNVEIYGGKDND